MAQKAAEATGDLIGNKIADKIASLGKIGKTNTKEKEGERQIYIPLEKRQQIIDDLRSDLCDFSDVCIVIKGVITLTKAVNRFYWNKKQVFKTTMHGNHNAPFTNCISKSIIVLIGNAEDFDVVTPM